MHVRWFTYPVVFVSVVGVTNPLSMDIKTLNRMYFISNRRKRYADYQHRLMQWVPFPGMPNDTWNAIIPLFYFKHMSRAIVCIKIRFVLHFFFTNFFLDCIHLPLLPFV